MMNLLEDTNSCPAFIEREAPQTPIQESPTISRLTARFGSSILASPIAISYDTPPTPESFRLNSPKRTPTSPTICFAVDPTTPYNCFLKRRTLYSPLRRSGSISIKPLKWDDDGKVHTSSAEEDRLPSVLPRKRAFTQSTPDFSALLNAENKAKLESPHEDIAVPCILPLIPKSSQDFNRIDESTLQDLLNGKYEDTVEKFIVMDCRYEYEYAGGHIRGAINMAPHMIFEYFKDIPDPVRLPVSKRRLVIVMHCEFSSARAPKCIEILRSLDRTENFKRGNVWPLVSYPDVYLLQGGYKKFFETSKEYCEPQAYIPEKAKEHKLERQETKRARERSLQRANSFHVSKLQFMDIDGEELKHKTPKRACSYH